MNSDEETSFNGTEMEVKSEVKGEGDKESREDVNADLKSTFQPSSVVLAKVKGYPPWPAMVLAENLLPENILAKKPKGGPGKVPRKGKGSKVAKSTKSASLGNGIPVSVRFFSDDTYIWSRESDLKLLTQDEIEQFLGKEDKRKAKLLKQAYELARDPPPIEEFIEYGSIGKTAFEEIQRKEEEKYAKAKAKIEAEEAKEEAKVAAKRKLEEEKKELKKKQRTGTGTGSTKREQAKERANLKAAEESKKKEELRKAKEEALRKKKEAKKKDAEKTSGYDSDWGIDIEYDHEAGDYIFEDPEEQEEFEENFAYALEIAQQSAEKTALLKKIKIKLQEILFPNESGEESEEVLSEETKPRQFSSSEVEEIIQEMKKLTNAKIPILIIKSSELLKLLVVALRQPKERLDNDKVRKTIAKYLKNTLDLTVRPNEIAEMILPTPEPENGQKAKSGTPSNGNGTPQSANGIVE